MEATDATPVRAVAADAFIGPAQVLVRIMEASVRGRFHPLVSTRFACISPPMRTALLRATGGALSILFAIFRNVGNGIPAIARATLPLAVFGPKNYGHRLGILGAPLPGGLAIAKALKIQPSLYKIIGG